MKTFKKIAGFVLIATGCFAAAFWLKFTYSHRLTSTNTGLRGITEATERIDYLFVGSSHTRMSYDMKLFCNETKTNSYALAYNGLSYYYMYPLLKHLVEETDVKPTMLVIESYVVTTSIPPILQDKWLFLESPPSLKKEILSLLSKSPEGLDWKQFYELTVSSKNQDLIFSPMTEVFLSKTYYHGTRVAMSDKTMAKEKFDALESPLERPGDNLTPIQMKSLGMILDLISKHDLEVVFVESPMPGRVEADPDYQLNKGRVKKAVEAQGIRYIDGAVDFPVNDYANFMDKGHLSAKGRELFTRKIIKHLQETTKP